jgi:hypothetical protein
MASSWTQYFPNSNLKRYCYMKLIDNSLSMRKIPLYSQVLSKILKQF